MSGVYGNVKGKAGSCRTWHRVVLGLFFIAGICDAQKPPRTGATADANLDRCLQGLSSCQVGSLKPEEITRLAEIYRRRNIDACRSVSSSCDPIALPKEELAHALAEANRR